MTIITLTRNTSKLYRNNDNNVVQKLNTQVKLYKIKKIIIIKPIVKYKNSKLIVYIKRLVL